jgi:hypothetical protein
MPPRKRASSSGGGAAAKKGAAKRDDAAEQRAEQAGGQSAPLERNPDADPVRIHREYVQQHLGGGALPTPEAYERALDQWHRLPGAVRGAAAEVHPDATTRAETELAETAAEETYDGPLPAADPDDNGPYERRRR